MPFALMPSAEAATRPTSAGPRLTTNAETRDDSSIGRYADAA